MKKIFLIVSVLLSSTIYSFSQNEVEKRLGIKPIEATLQATTPNGNLDCGCKNNILLDGGFQKLTDYPGSTNISTSSNPWQPNSETPQWSSTAVPFACETGVVSMWGNKVVGESILQTGVPFIAGHHYKVKITARFQNPTSLSSFVRLKVTATSGSGYNPSGTSVMSPNITSTGWGSYNIVADLVPTAGQTNLELQPDNDYSKNDGNYVSWIQIDNICIEDACDCSKPTNTNVNFSLTTTLGGGTTATASAIGASTGLGNGWTLKEVSSSSNNPCKWVPGAIKWQTTGTNITIPSGVLVPGKCYILTHYVNVCSTKWDPKECMVYKTICFCLCDNSINTSPDTKGASMQKIMQSTPEDEGVLKEAQQLK